MKKQMIIALCACVGLGFASCSDNKDDVTAKDTTTTVTDDTFDDEKLSDAYIIDHVMSQFAELNADGTLKKRTTYFRQMDESDSTAIYTIAESKERARAKFLGLLPETYQKMVEVKNDSAEMSIAIGSSGQMLTYTEGGEDGNVVATVQLPATESYKKIATTLRMVKSFGANWDINYNKYVCRFYKKKIKVLTTPNPIGIGFASFNKEDYDVHVEEAELSMLCYYINEDGKAQYVFLPPFNKAEYQLKLPSGNYLLGIYQPYFLPGRNGNEIDLKKMADYLEVFPKPKTLTSFAQMISHLGDNRGSAYYLDLRTLRDHYEDKWKDDALEEWIDLGKYKKDSTDYYKGALEYFSKMENFFRIKSDQNNAPSVVAQLSDYFPYQQSDFKNSKDIPGVQQYVIDKGKPFFIDGYLKTDPNKLEDLIFNQSIPTSQVYSRDENNGVHIANYYYSSMGEFEVLEIMKDRFYQSYFKPYNTYGEGSIFYEYKKYGRSMSVMSDWLRIIYLYEDDYEEHKDDVSL